MQADGASRDVHAGGCLCGRVRYTVAGPPVYQANCHCGFCRKVTGSAYLVEAVFPADRVRFEGLAPKVYEQPSPAHGRRMRVQFCPECGTTVGLGFERFPGLQALCVGTFDDPGWVAVQRHIFVDSAMAHVVFPGGVDLFAGHSMTLSGRPERPLPASDSPRSAAELQARPEDGAADQTSPASGPPQPAG